jgi:Rod binding domain-containing protein
MDGIGLATESLTPGLLSPLGLVAEGGTRKVGPTDALAKTAKDFESVLVHKLMEEMSKTVGEGGLLDSQMTQQTEGLFWFYLAQEVSQGGGLGLWKEIARRISPSDTAAEVKPADRELLQ